MRAPFQVLVFPFIRQKDVLHFVLFRRADDGRWQGIAGGGKGAETPLQTAVRESAEEATINAAAKFIQLESRTTIPVVNVSGFLWGKEVPVIPEYAFGVEIEDSTALQLSEEHTELAVVTLDEAMDMLHWDSNKTAIWELHHRLQHNMVSFTD